MKPCYFQVAALVLALLGSSAWGGDPYPMGAIPLGDARWTKVVGMINEKRSGELKAARKDGLSQQIKITQHLEGTSYLAEIRTPGGVAGSYAGAMNTLFGRPAAQLVEPGSWKLVRMDLPAGSKRLADEEFFTEKVTATGEVYEYQAVTGAKNSVKVYQLAGAGEKHGELSVTELMGRLKAGETFEVTVQQLATRCVFCRGKGKIEGVPCPRCEARGGVAVDREMTVCW